MNAYEQEETRVFTVNLPKSVWNHLDAMKNRTGIMKGRIVEYAIMQLDLDVVIKGLARTDNRA